MFNCCPFWVDWSELTEVSDLNVLSTVSNDRVDGEMGVYEPHLVLETLLKNVL